jgi:glucose/arabinose dehydrogenase
MTFCRNRMRTSFRIPALASVLALAAMGISCVQAQIKFTDAFPGTTFDRPVYFGVFPGKAKTYVVLEAHEGQATLVSQKGAGWVKDTLLRIAVNQADEMGLLGIAFHPDFVHNRKYYVSYDPPGTLYNIVEERIADSTLLKDSGAKGRILIKIADKYENHNGGTIAFGPKDGFLYFGIGDGGSGGDPDGNGQNTNVLLGKMLRIDVDKKDAGEYGIPSDNPFAVSGGRKEIFAYGLRNPWKWSFDPVTGDLWVGDVGQDKIEEVDILSKGGNFGWSSMEGPEGANNGSMSLPVYSYTRADGNCVIGGVVFRGSTASKYYGTYFATDLNTKTLWNLKKNGTGLATATSVGTAPTSMSSFGTDEAGRIYMCGLNTGVIYFLDSPDLQGGSAIRTQADLSAWRHDHVFMAAAGSRMDARAFAGAPGLELLSVEGVRVGVITKLSPMVPKRTQPGIYLLRKTGIRGGQDMLVVR